MLSVRRRFVVGILDEAGCRKLGLRRGQERSWGIGEGNEAIQCEYSRVTIAASWIATASRAAPSSRWTNRGSMHMWRAARKCLRVKS